MLLIGVGVDLYIRVVIFATVTNNMENAGRGKVRDRRPGVRQVCAIRS